MPKIPKRGRLFKVTRKEEPVSLDLDELVEALNKMVSDSYQLAGSLREWRDKVERERDRLSPDKDEIPF